MTGKLQVDATNGKSGSRTRSMRRATSVLAGLDLKTYGVRRLSFFTAFPLDEYRRAAEEALGSPLPSEVVHLEETRPRGGARFAILHIESERSVLHIDGFAYAVAGRSQSGPDREGEVTPQQSPAEFLDRFGREINRPVRAIVGGEIRLEPDTFLLKFPLPIDVQPPVPGFQFNELRGAHLAKTEAGQVAPQHEVILDLSWTSALSLSMTVNVEVQVASTILRESLGHVLRVAGYVVERRSSQAAPNSRREQP